MNPQNEKNAVYKDEINLYHFWKVIERRKKLILGIFLISVISTAIMSLSMPKIYKGEAFMRIALEKEVITAKELNEVLGKIDKEQIAKIFSEQPDSIKKVIINPIPGSSSKFKVAVEIKDIAYFQYFMDRFIEHLNRLPLIKISVEQQKEKLTKRLEEIDSVIEKSQQDSKSFQKMINKGKLNPVGFNPVDFNRALSELKIEKITLQQGIQNLRGVELITLPTIPSRPFKPRPLIDIAIAGLTSLIAGMIIVAILNYLEKMKKYQEH